MHTKGVISTSDTSDIIQIAIKSSGGVCYFGCTIGNEFKVGKTIDPLDALIMDMGGF